MKIRAVVLYSGSLASIIAAKLAQLAGAPAVSFVFFRSPFFGGEEAVVRQAQRLGFPLRCITLKRAFLRLPQTNGPLFPCRECRRIILARATRLFRNRKFDLIITGEVVGKAGLGLQELLSLDAELRLAGRVLRPLSAKLLPPTWAEAQGLINRNLFGDLTVDGLEPRLYKLAAALGIPLEMTGRSCLLSTPSFAQRCQAFAQDKVFTANLVRLLAFPHLVRLGPGRLLVVAFTPAEQVQLGELFLPEDIRLYIPIAGSPLGLLRAPWAKLVPAERERLVHAAAAHLLALAGFRPNQPWTVCFRAEEAEETARLWVTPRLLQASEISVS